jgi:prepilin-type N-terminal cleavage/methylation domain-containing protein
MADPWSPDPYQRFQPERALPYQDLLGLWRPSPVRSAVDLGCGTGELTQQLHQRTGAGPGAAVRARARGYTLVELMTVVAILAVLAAMSAAAIGPMVQRLRVSQATAVATAALALARAQARASLRCAEVDVATPVPGTPASALAPAAPGAAGTLLRVWRWNDLTCAGGHAHATLVQSFPVPAQMGVALGAPALRFLGNGRAAAPVSVAVDALGGSSRPDAVVVTPVGVICAFAGAPGACP